MEAIARPDFRVSVMAIMTFQVAALFARSALEISLIEAGHPVPFAEDLSYLVVPPILLLLMVPYLRRCKDSLLLLMRRADLTIRVVVLSVMLGILLRVLYWAVLTLLIRAGVLGGSEASAAAAPFVAFRCPPLPVLLLSIVVVSILVPVIEETLNRGFILHAMLPRGTAASVFLSSILFALMHRPSSYLLAFCIGLLLAMQLLNYRTLWAPMIAHAAYNTSAVLDWECLRLVWNPPPSDPALQMLGQMSAAVVLFGTCAALFLVSKKAAGAHKAPRQESFRV